MRGHDGGRAAHVNQPGRGSYRTGEGRFERTVKFLMTWRRMTIVYEDRNRCAVYSDLPARQSQDAMDAGLESLRNLTRDDSW